jgi:simple sugar transport system substrate-binding protein
MSRKLISLLLAAVLGLMIVGSPSAAQTTEQPIVIYFFCGGPAGGSFATVVYNGARAAAEILGDRVKVNYVFSDWNPEKMVADFQQAVAAQPDGICVMGHPGVDALKPFVDEAEKEGIIVTSQNVDLPALETQYRAEGFGYVGQNLYDSGSMLGKAAGERAGLKSGDRAMVWGLLNEPTRGLRTKGAIDALEAMGVTVDYIQITPDVDKDASAGVPIFVGYMQKHPDCKLVITDHGQLTATLPAYLEAAGLAPGQIFAAGFDLAPSTLQGIESGYVQLVHSQQPFLQGFLPIFQIYLTVKYKVAGLDIDTGIGLIDKTNVGLIAPLVQKGLAG